jgi:probable selenium-dependent hydroxylase accessory protein YqeC
MSDDLLTTLNAHRGIVCVVGAGGKKTTLYALARCHKERVGVTTTVQLPPFPRSLPGQRVIAAEPKLLEQVIAAVREHRIVAFAQPSKKPHRISGISGELLTQVWQQAGLDLLLVKADGARQRAIKAPAAYEPVLPAGTDTVLALVSAGVLRRPLNEALAHRVELLEAITGACRDALLQPEHLARLLASDQGLLKGIGKACVIPIINQVDDAERQALAAQAARRALALSNRFDRIVLTTMRRPQPIVQVIYR